MTDDTLSGELKAMQDLAGVLAELDADAKRRVLKWAADRYQAKPAAPQPAAHHEADHSATPPPPPPREPAFGDFADLFDAANPESGVENALVAGYWFQAVQKNAELDSQQLNSALKNLGRPSSNITRDLDSLMTRSPRLVIQVRKDGNTKQARKRYKLTTEGLRSVERMLARTGRVEPAAAVEEGE